MAAKKTYSFPVMSDNQIAETLNELYTEMSVTSQDIKECKSHVVVNIYMHCLSELRMPVSDSQHNIPPFSKLMDPESLEHHDHIQGLVPLYQTLCRLFPKIGVHDFAFMDLLSPVPKKTRGHISALMNFARFCNQHEETFFALTKEKEELAERSRQQKEILARRKQALNALASTHSELKSHGKLRKEKEEQLKKQLELQIVEKDKLTQEKHESKNVISELEDKVAKEHLTIASLTQEEKRLSAKLVQSPGRVKEQRRRLEERVTDLQQGEIKKSQVIAHRNKEITELKTSIKNMEELVNLHNDLAELLKTNSELLDQASQSDACIKLREVDLRDITSQILRLEEELQGLQAREVAARVRHEQGLGELKHTWEQQLSLKDDLNKKMNQNNKVSEHYDKTIAELQNDVDTERRAFNKMVETNRAAYHEMLSEFKRTLEEFDTAVAKFTERVRNKPDVLTEALEMMKEELAQFSGGSDDAK